MAPKPLIIAGPSSSAASPPWRFAVVVALASAAWGSAAAAYYCATGLSLSHYDAKAHLVVARRIVDSLTPGWQQIGGVWLPLPHLLNMLPVQADVMYRTGMSAVAMSVASFAVAVTAMAWLVARATRSALAGGLAALALGTDPNVLYLQATPMTEALCIGLMLLALALVWVRLEPGSTAPAWPAGLVLTAACLTRYEAWPFTAAVLAIVGLVRFRRGEPAAMVVREAARLALGPVAAGAGFLLLSRATVGAWFVAGGFYEVDERTLGHAAVSAAAVTWGTRQLTGSLTYVAGVVGLAAAGAAVARRRLPTETLVVAALLGCAALPFYAFVSGHPFRVRYMVPLVPVVAAGVGLGAGLVPRRARPAVVALAAIAVLLETPPFSPGAAIVAEAQWDRPRATQRLAVTRCLDEQFRRDQDAVLASMASLAHYMQELSAVGFNLRDFVHEGNGDRWNAALRAPASHVRWILAEEQSEGGDVLARRRREDPSFFEGFDRVCEGGGVALYRRR